MADEENVEEAAAVEEEQQAPMPDPRDEELQRLRQEKDRLMAHILSQPQPQQASAQQAPLQNVDLDYSDAEEVGMTPAQLRKAVAKAEARMAPVFERLYQEIQANAPRPKSAEELIAEISRDAGYQGDEVLAWGALTRKAAELKRQGIEPTSPQGRMILVEDLKSVAARVAPKVSPANVPPGASVPKGIASRASQPKVKTLCEVISADQKRRGLY